MPSIAENLAKMAPEVEAQIKPWRVLIGGYLPQTWVFVTESESATLQVSKSGAVTAHKGALPSPDVTIRAPHARLSVALETRDKNRVPPGPEPEVVTHTSKGAAAWSFLKGRFGF